ncbi:MAG: thiamine phosphate synthase [Pirellulaceae bacterium]|nr:thiamine phosphate synthase [Pirellulaceae bacterium]
MYVLVDGRSDDAQFEHLVADLIESRIDVVQLRDKQMPDRQLIGRARLLRELTRGTDTLFIVNDRPDMARLAEADGVHVGQDELTVADVRRIVGTECAIGVSTHSIEQARQAVQDGADYLGCGPTYPSATKDFEQFPGLAFLRQVAAELTLPAFAIGGIRLDRLPAVFETGFRRVAVSAAITQSSNPAESARQMRAAIDQLSGPQK